MSTKQDPEIVRVSRVSPHGFEIETAPSLLERAHAARHAQRIQYAADVAERAELARIAQDPLADFEARRRARAALLGHRDGPLPEPPSSEESAPTLKRRR